MTENRRPQTVTDGGQKALPKAISDAIDAYQKRCADVVASVALKQSAESVAMTCRDVNHARAALERAIEEHVAPVAAPTEAEIEDWSRRMNNANNGDKPGWIDELRREAVAIMRRAAAAKPVVEPWPNEHGTHDVKLHYDGTRTVEGITFTLTDRKTGVVTRYVPESAAATPAASWDGGPTVTAMMRGVEDAAIEWVKCVVDYNASCQAAPPPSGLEASEAVRKAGHKCELAYGYFQKAITALADHRATPAPSALKPGSPQHVAIWDAINEVVAASGGSTSTTNIARQKAVVSVERALREALVQATSALDRLRERVFGWSMTSMLGEDASQALRMVLRWIDEEREREAKR